MKYVHVFISSGRFRSSGELRTFIHKAYNDDGDGIASQFMREVGLTSYEPSCIELVESDKRNAMPLIELLEGASYAEQWLPMLEPTRTAEVAVCVFQPNQLAHPERSSLEYLGTFAYKP